MRFYEFLMQFTSLYKNCLVVAFLFVLHNTNKKNLFLLVQSLNSPTPTTYSELQQAYDFLNTKLFDDELPPCLITLQRERNTCGYFSGRRFINRSGERTDEIALNPTYFAVQPIKEVLSTLGHEMVHLWQAHNGKSGRGRYHNKEWAAKMNEIELIPSDTGQPGGKQTGDKMSDYIESGGLFDRVCDELLTTEFQISWFDRFIPRIIIPTLDEISRPVGSAELSDLVMDQADKPPFTSSELRDLDFETPQIRPTKSTRVKYRCPECGDQAWGKPGLVLLCGKCNGEAFAPVDL